MDQQLLIIAACVGAVVAGLIWIVWSLVENVAHFAGRDRSAKTQEEMGSGEGI